MAFSLTNKKAIKFGDDWTWPFIDVRNFSDLLPYYFWDVESTIQLNSHRSARLKERWQIKINFLLWKIINYLFFNLSSQRTPTKWPCPTAICCPAFLQQTFKLSSSSSERSRLILGSTFSNTYYEYCKLVEIPMSWRLLWIKRLDLYNKFALKVSSENAVCFIG